MYITSGRGRENGVVMYIISGRGLKTGSARALVCTLVNGTSENKHFNFNQAILLGSFFLNLIFKNHCDIYMHAQKRTVSTREKDLSYIEKVDVCLPSKTPKKKQRVQKDTCDSSTIRVYSK